MQYAFFALLMLSVSSPNESPEAHNAFVPGQKMVFPVSSDGVVADLVKRFEVNCRSEDSSVTDSCLTMLSERGESCEPKPLAVFKSEEQYRVWAKAFTACLMPRPVCSGREVESIEECAPSRD